MSKWRSRWLAAALCAGVIGSAAAARAQDDDEALGFERTPPRLSFTDGEVSYFRPGADDWTPAVVNTALAPGDELYTAASANVELQIGARAYARAGEKTQLALTSLEPDFLQLRVTSGHVSLDLRSLKTGQSFEIDTPNGAFTVERSGYYRVAVDEATTTFTSRRGGRATLTPAAGESLVIAANEQVVVTGTDAPQIETYAAPELDRWDRWNYARTDDQQGAVSARYVPSGVYGTDDLDRYGDWRVVPTYGAFWVPRGVAAGWAPYSTGRWVLDPYYGWTWVDTAPWGWAPYHYGRWVHHSGYWGWCPGPIVARSYYAPALVAFYGGGGFSVGVTIGAPYVGWVALGWGEPLVPWWGPARFRGYPRWAGWGGPRYVNNVAYHHKRVYNVREINVYRNARVRDAIVAVDREHFGRRSRDGARFTRGRADRFAPLHGDPGVRPDRSSLVAEARSSRRPPREQRQRSVVATREPRIDAVQGPTRVVDAPREGRHIQASRRPPFGTQSESERRTPRRALRFEQREAAAQASPPAALDRARERALRTERSRRAPAEPRSRAARPERTLSRLDPPAERAQRAQPGRGERSGRREPASAPRRELPGEPASRLFQQRSERPELMERAERPALQERLERRGRQERIERAGRDQQMERAARQPQMERPVREARIERTGGEARARGGDGGSRGGGGGRGGRHGGGNSWGGERGSSRGR